MPLQTNTAREVSEKYDLSYYNRPIPKSFLQAAELEDEDFGKIRTSGPRIEYVDLATRVVFLSKTYSSSAEAGTQLRFYRQSYKDVLTRRSELRIVN
jgi:hypothetical protein